MYSIFQITCIPLPVRVCLGKICAHCYNGKLTTCTGVVEDGWKGPRARDVKAGTYKSISQLPVHELFSTAFNSVKRSRASCLLAMTNISCEAMIQLSYCISCLDFVHSLLQQTINLVNSVTYDATNPALGVFKCLNDCFLRKFKHRIEMKSSYYSFDFLKSKGDCDCQSTKDTHGVRWETLT